MIRGGFRGWYLGRGGGLLLVRLLWLLPLLALRLALLRRVLAPAPLPVTTPGVIHPGPAVEIRPQLHLHLRLHLCSHLCPQLHRQVRLLRLRTVYTQEPEHPP
ncbi:hypothetical protein B0J18DRAFT_422854 [Chaetomium sp. MPI-SDFR-AT-0129]|nr:hypothetical protein B0J18DRAFT_422854 [Chaetomium sp. MPI-SDFR-AT-0129]